MMRLTAGLRKKLKRPLGKVQKDLRKGTGKLISVGDVVSYELIQRGVVPDLIIYDGRVKRRPAPIKVSRALEGIGRETFHVSNPRGTISEEAWIAIEAALRKKSMIRVSGEEDLLALPAAILAKPGAVIVYGQPGKGMVMMKVTEQKKKEIRKLIGEMEVVA